MTPEIDELANRYREAWLTARRLPTGIRLGHTTSWPEMRLDQREQVRRAEREVIFVRPTALQEDRLVECMNWLTPLTVEERNVIWLRASGLSWRRVGERLQVTSKTARVHWCQALNRLQIYRLSQMSRVICP